MSNPMHYSGPELGALLAQVREELGEEATIHQANKVRSGGIAGFFAKESFEISASSEAAHLLASDLDDEHSIGTKVVVPIDEIVHDDKMVHDIPIPTALDELRYQTAPEPVEFLEPLDVIGDLAGTSLPRKTRVKMPTETMKQEATATLRREPPARISGSSAPERPALVFNFENLGPSAIPARLQQAIPVSAREPIPTPSPLRSQLESSSVPSTTVGERVADALMERAELVNALEHLDKTDELIAAQFDETAQTLAPLSDVALSDETFENILQRTLSTPHVEEAETLTTAEAVAQRIASQNSSESSPVEAPETPVPELVEEPEVEIQPPVLTSRAPIPVEPGATRQHPDFWSRMRLAQEEIALYQLGRSNVTAIVGPLDLALPVARQCQQEDWIGVEDMAILSSRPSIPGSPSWQVVSKVDDLHWAMTEWCANQRRGLVVVDTADLPSSQLQRFVTQLRSNGADIVRLATPADFDVTDFVALSQEIGGKLAVDLALGTEPSAILRALDEGLIIGSVGGRSLTPELLVALRVEVARTDTASSDTASSDTASSDTASSDVAAIEDAGTSSIGREVTGS